MVSGVNKKHRQGFDLKGGEGQTGLALGGHMAAGLSTSKGGRIWATEPSEPERGGENELVLDVDAKDPTILHMRDSSPSKTKFYGKYRIAADNFSKLANGR